MDFAKNGTPCELMLTTLSGCIYEEVYETMKMIRAFIWGGAIGAVIGLLFAPQRGEVTREQLQQRLNQWQAQAQSRATELRGAASNAVESGRSAINSTTSKTQQAANNAADNAQSALSGNTTR